MYKPLKAELDKLRVGVARLQYLLDHAAANAEKATLPEFAKRKFDRIVAKEIRALRAQFAAAVAAKVKKLVVLKEQHYIEKVSEANQLLERLWAHQEMLSQSMTLEEFKRALGCVHPDLQLENEHTGYAPQFQILKEVATPPRGRKAQGRVGFESPE